MTLETRIVVLAEGSEITLPRLTEIVQSLEMDIEVKETCYGLMLQGEKGDVQKAVEAIRRIAPYSIFTKERGFCIGDKKRCRTGKEGGLSGAARPGYHQLELESQQLEMIGTAIRTIGQTEGICKATEPARIDEEALRAMVRKIMSGDAAVDS